MSILTMILATAVAFEFFYIFYLETVVTTSDTTARVFNVEKEVLKHPTVNVLFKNQGVYNALIGVLVLLSTYVFTNSLWLFILMLYIIAVASYGALTSDKMILLKQGGFAIMTIVSLIFSFFF